MNKIFKYVNPLSKLGERKYSVLFPLIANLAVCLLSEIYAFWIIKNAMAVGVYIIFVNIILIIYFSFRDGIRGGFVSTSIAIFYYFYIIFTRNYSGNQLINAVETSLILGGVYYVLALIIGWLKQQIDKLIEREADEKKRLEIIIQQLPVGVLITDNEGNLIQRNTQIDKILGMELPIGFRLGRDSLYSETINGETINPKESPLYQSLQTGKAVIGKEFIFKRRDDKVVNLQVSAAPILNKHNKVIAAASIITDISQQKELERQKDDFLAIASHELKTPVTSIKAYGQSLESNFRKKGEIKAADQLKKLDAQVDKLTHLIGDLLDVTKIQSGRLLLNPVVFEFDQLITEMTDELQLTTEKHRLVTTLDAKAKVRADRERISQVITNLIANAIKYSPNAEKIIVNTYSDKDNVYLSVQDYGLGIPSDKKDKVFEQFYRVSGPHQNTFPGLGLGLYISAEIVKREGGRIWVESTEGKGSTFYFCLPIFAKEL